MPEAPFKVGDRVKCINNQSGEYGFGDYTRKLDVGGVYTITKVYKDGPSRKYKIRLAEAPKLAPFAHRFVLNKLTNEDRVKARLEKLNG